MKLLLTFLTALICFIGNGQQNHFDAGNTAYSIGDYNAALSEYNKAVGADILSEALFYNLGNTYYKLEEYGEAIWAYEKAIRLDPNSENAHFNLALVNEKIVKDVSISEGGIADWLKINLFGFSINFWAFATLFFSLILTGCIYFFLTTLNQKLKNRALTLGLSSVFLGFIVFTIAALHKNEIISDHTGVIINKSVIVYNTPTDDAEIAFELHEGNIANLLRTNNNWYEIDVNGNVGWIAKKDFWKI